MKIELWADIICPWCGLGDHRLTLALRQFEHANDVQVRHRSFQLDANFPERETITARELLVMKYGLAPEQASAAQKRVEDLAAADGLAPYIVADNHVGNTGLAHELLAYASSLGMQAEAWSTMLRAYFGEAHDIFRLPGLLDLAERMGLGREATRHHLERRTFRDAVANDMREAQALGVRGVPFFVIDERYGISGAQPVETIVAALQRAWSETYSLQHDRRP
jgi:predicted DsbA family dithiol-disulfide isomerase